MSEDKRDFVESLGPAFLAHLLRRLSDELVEADKLWHAQRGIANPPRTSSTLLALDAHGAMSVTGLAQLLRQSHQLVQQWIQQLRSLGLVDTSPDPNDRRRSLVSLTDEGRAHVDALRRAIVPIEEATSTLLQEIAPGMFEALWDLEHDLRDRPFIGRIRAAAKGGAD